MRLFSKFNYNIALRDYYHKTRGHVVPSVSDKLQYEINTIEEFEKRNLTLTKSEVIIRLCLRIVGQFIGMIVFSTLVIYVIAEVFDIAIAYSAKNILLLALLAFASRVKFRLAE